MQAQPNLVRYDPTMVSFQMWQSIQFRLRWSVVVLTLLCASACHAASFLTAVDWLEDPDEHMQLSQVQQTAGWQSVEHNVFTQGFSASAFWFRLRIDPHADHEGGASDDDLIVRIRPIFHDEIQLYDPLDRSGKIRVTGDRYPWGQSEARLRDLNFRIPRGDAPRDVWLRLHTHNSTLAVFSVFPEREGTAQERQVDVLIMFSCSVIFLCMGWGIFSWLQQRDRLVFLYVFREASTVLYGMVYLGYLRISFSDQVIAAGYDFDVLSNLIVWVHIAFVVYFDRHLLIVCKPNRHLLFAMGLLVWALLPEVGLMLVGDMAHAVQLNNLVILLGLVLALGCVATSTGWRAEDPQERPPFSPSLLYLAYALVCAVILLQRVATTGWWPYGEVVTYAQFLYPVGTSLVMMILLKTRSDAMQTLGQVTHTKLVLAEQRAEQQRQQRVEQSNFLQMLVHEMKTPLSVIRMAVGMERRFDRFERMVDHAISDMNRVLEHLVEVERFADQRIAVQRQPLDVAALLRTLQQKPAMAGRVVLENLDVFAGRAIVTDENLVHMILSNLLDNACKYGAADAPVRVGLRADGDWLVIAVRNRVGFVGAPDPQRVFEKYYRAPRASEQTGSGLGLYLSRSLAHLLGGELRLVADPVDDDFVVFALRLPATPAEAGVPLAA